MAKGSEQAAEEHMKGSRKGEEKGGKGEEPKSGGEGGKGTKLHEIRTRFTHSGAAIHEHHFRDKKGNTLPHKPEYVSTNMDDLHDHMNEHAGPVMQGEDGDGESGGDETGGGSQGGDASGGGEGEEE